MSLPIVFVVLNYTIFFRYILILLFLGLPNLFFCSKIGANQELFLIKCPIPITDYTFYNIYIFLLHHLVPKFNIRIRQGTSSFTCWGVEDDFFGNNN